MTIPFDLPMFIIAAVVVTGAYVIFGISAFGAALFTVPILSHFLPLDFVLPMCVLLDACAALTLGARFSREADWSELKWMVPLSLAGAIAGVTLLVALPRQATIAGIGAFLVAYGLYAMRQREAGVTVSRAWALVAGFTGGACGTPFALAGLWLGNRIHGRASRGGVLRVVAGLIFLIGLSLLARAFA
jgi:uncharacterized membrane protein YfcA